MFQDTSTIEYKHKKFIERVVDFGKVWILESDEGFATSDSNDFEDAKVIPFWSDKAYASILNKEEWSNYWPTSMTIAEFMESWLIGMFNDGFLVGTNWDANLFGKEIEPLTLALQLTDELIVKGKTIAFSKFTDIIYYQIQVRKALE